MLFDITDGVPLSEEDIKAVKQHAMDRVHMWRKRAILAMVAFFLSCAAVIPFSAGHALNSQWESLGKYLVLLSMMLLPIFVCCAALWWVAWRALCDVDKTYR